MSVIFAGKACYDPSDLLRECQQRGWPVDWYGRANVYRCPLGREPGRGGLLMRRGDLDLIDFGADHTLEIGDNQGGASKVSLKKLTILKTTCLTPGAVDSKNATYLVDVVDRRYHLARVPCDVAYNLRAADGASYRTATLNAGIAWTWTQLVTDLWSTCGGLGTFPGMPFTPAGTPGGFDFFGGFAWDALCRVLDRLACAPDYDPVADAFTVVRLGSADTTATAGIASMDAMLTAEWDTYPMISLRAERPEKVRVLYRRYPVPTGGETPWYSVDVTLAAATGVVAGSYVQVVDDEIALGATGTPSNSAALGTRASERAADWLRKYQGYDRRYVRVYGGISPDAATKVLGSTMAAVNWEDRGQGARTELVSGPDGKLEKWAAPRVSFDPWTVAAGSLLLSETETEAATEMSVDTDEAAPIVRFLKPLLRVKKGATDADPKTVESLGIITGNQSTEESGTEVDEPTTELRGVAPIRILGNDGVRTVAMIPPDEEGAEGYTTVDIVTNVCPIKKWLSITLSGATLETLVATPVLGDTETPGVSVEVVTGIIVETTPIKLLTGSAGDPLCTEDPLDCCPVWYCVDGDVITQGGSLPPPEGTSVLGPFDTEVEADAACLCSTCEPCAGMEALPSGTTHVVLAGVDTGAGDNGCGEFESYAHRTVFEKQWSFCLPLGCVYTIRVENQTTPGIPSQAGSCEGGDDLDIVVHNGGCEGTVVQSLVTGNCCTTPEFPLELVVPELPTDPVDLIEDCAVVTVTYSFSYPHDDAWVDPSMEFDLVVTLECGTET